MGIKSFTVPLVTRASPQVIMEAIVDRLRPFGGQIQPGPNEFSFTILGGDIGITGSFLMEISAQISLVHRGGDNYMIHLNLNKEPSTVFWVFLGCGLLFYLLWVGNLIYFFIEPEKMYSDKLQNLGFELDNRMSGQNMNFPPHEAPHPPYNQPMPPQRPPQASPQGYQQQPPQAAPRPPQQASPPPAQPGPGAQRPHA